MQKITKMTGLNDACNLVAETLPIGWEISILLELDSGAVILEDPDGEPRAFPCNHEGGIAELLNDALTFAVAQATRDAAGEEEEQ